MKLKIIEKYTSPFGVITYIRYLIPENTFEIKVVQIIDTLRKTARRLERQWANKCIRDNKVVYGPSVFNYHCDSSEDLS